MDGKSKHKPSKNSPRAQFEHRNTIPSLKRSSSKYLEIGLHTSCILVNGKKLYPSLGIINKGIYVHIDIHAVWYIAFEPVDPGHLTLRDLPDQQATSPMWFVLINTHKQGIGGVPVMYLVVVSGHRVLVITSLNIPYMFV